MKAYDFLKRIKVLNILINNKKIELESLEALCEYPPLNNSEKVQSSSVSDSSANRIINYIELKAELENKIDELCKIKQEVIDVIDKVDNPRIVDLLYKKYVHCKTWQQISDESGLSRQWLWKLDSKAMKKVQKILDSL